MVRRTGNDGSLVDLAVAAAVAVGAGHSIFCATANPVQILVAVTDAGRSVARVIDGEPPVGVENETHLLRGRG